VSWPGAGCVVHCPNTNPARRHTHTPHPPQKRQPTSFQLFPNAREIVIEGWDKLDLDRSEQSLLVPGIFRLPGAPDEAAAARAALAGVTRLEMLHFVPEPEDLAAALLLLPGLRAMELACDGVGFGKRGAQAFGSDLLAALAGCSQLESLEWDLSGWNIEGASGSGGRGPRKRIIGAL
jgi:hypothetical protein